MAVKFAMFNPTTQGQQAQGAQLNADQYNQDRQSQLALLGRYQGMANGTGPSLAMGQLQAGQQQAQQHVLGMMGAGRGTNPGLAMYGAQQAMAGAGQQAAGQAAGLRQQEQLGAMGAQGSLLGQLQGNALQLSGQNAQLQQGNQQFNAQQANGLLGQRNDIMAQQYGQQNGYLAQQALAQQQADLQMRNQAIQGLVGAGSSIGGMGAATAMGGPGALAALSDERAKTDVQPGRSKLAELLEPLGAHDYRYKDAAVLGASPGRHVSVMAQELEKSELGRSMVSEGADGLKRVDYAKALPSMLSALAELWNDRRKAA